MSISGNFPSIRPSLLLDFANVGRLDPRVTFTRASNATYFDQLGVLQSASNGVARFDYNPSTLAAQGLLIEEQRTNSIRNNTMQGAVAGTPGTLPTNWVSSTLSGLTREVVGIGTVNGITYIDVRYSGTPTITGVQAIQPEGNTSVAALQNQIWTGSFWVSLVGGTLTNIGTISVGFVERDSGGVALTSGNGQIFTPTSTLTRYAYTRTLTNAATAYYGTTLRLSVTDTVTAIDITLRIGLPQLEQGAFATSVIPTTTTALTRSADVASMTGTNFSSWYNNAAGTFLIQYSSQATAGTDRRVLTLEDANGITVNGALMFIGDAVQKAASFNNFVSSSNIGRIDSVAAFSANTTYKGAFAMTNSDRGLSVNGAAAVTSTNAFSMPSLIRMYIGQNGAGSFSINSYIQRIAYYPVRLSDAQLQALTG